MNSRAQPDPPSPEEPRTATPLEERAAFRRAIGVGLFVWPSFFALDAYMALVVAPGAPLGLFLGYRLGFELLLLALWWRGRRPQASGRMLRAAIRTMAYGAALAISLMAIHLGGLGSPYVHGLGIVVLVMSVTIPTPWRVSLTWLVPTVLMFPAVMAAAAPWAPSVRAAWADSRQLAMFGANYFFVLASALIGSASGHRMWLARRQLYEARRLGRYRLKAPIGRGAMNEVWLAWDETLRRDVALKILRASEHQERTALERFLREAQTLSRLVSPHTVRVYDFGGSDDGLYFIAMERLVGSDLQRLLRRAGPLNPARVRHVARQVCLSLTEAHEAGVVHRDLKPANIFLTRAGVEFDFVKVVDFGLAKAPALGPRLTQNLLIGTPHFIAPEVWQGGQADARSDLYSLGGTLYALLAGKEPFAGLPTMHAMARAHLETEPAPLSALTGGRVPASLEAVVSRCLSKKPEDRFPSAAALLETIEACRDLGGWTAEDARRAWSEVPVDGALWGSEAEVDESQEPTLAIPAAERGARRP